MKMKYVATIGFFDGVHSGHRYLIERVREVARIRGLQSMVVTFPVHPRKVLQADYQPQLLTTKDEKLELLAKTGVDKLVLLDFDREMARMTAREFMQMLHRDYAVEVLIVGYDHRFGQGRTACFEDYVTYGKELSMEVLRAEELKGGASSTVVRRALLGGDVALANSKLGYRYFLHGKVVHGFRNGTRMGFPTANLQVEEDKLIPMNGAYGVEVTVAGKVYQGMLNIGQRPTLDNGEERSVEVHIFDCQMDLYDQWLCVEFLFFLRAEKKFLSVDELCKQLDVDKSDCKRMFSVLN